jgi:AraC-like DNA-binding protein
VIDPGEVTYLPELKARLKNCFLLHHKDHQVARDIFLANSIDLVLLDHSREIPCFKWLSQFKASKPSIPVVIMTDQGSEAIAVKAFRQGARDYFHKPLPLDKLELVCRKILGMRAAAKSSPEGSPLAGLELAFAHIHGHFKSPLSLALVAEKADMSISSFVRRFKKKTGLTFVDYINSLRLSRAAELLKDSRLSLLEVALSSGFNNQSHFNRMFKKINRVTPGQYRRDLNERPHR